MKKSIITIITALMTMPIALFGQSYSALWKQVQEAADKDLPQTQYEILQKIVAKASREKAYGQLLKAELKGMQTMQAIAPDSLKPAVERMMERTAKTGDTVLKTVYQTIAYQICTENTGLELEAEKPVLSEQLCQQLAQVRDESFVPFIVKQTDSKAFDHDLLSVIGFELKDYQPLYTYYNKVGNRQAVCVTAARLLEEDKLTVNQADSLMSVHASLPEAGEIAIARYWATCNKMSAEEKVRYIDEALRKWGAWKRMNQLRNMQKTITNPQFEVSYDKRINEPQQPLIIRLRQLRNLSSLTLNVYRVNANGDIDINPGQDYKKIKPLLSPLPIKHERRFMGKQPYELFEDSLQLEGLPVGVYMLEFSSAPSTEVIRQLYFVTDVYTMAEPQPDGRTRYVVVSATTGQPIAKAHLRIRQYTSYRKYETTEATTDGKGEYFFKSNKNHRCEVFAYTDGDKACPELSVASQYRHYEAQEQVQQTGIFTDRAIYRPGQTVHAAVMIYDIAKGWQHQATEGKQVTFALRDANWKEVARQKGVTDAYGVCAADFTLPSNGLTGSFTIQANGQSHTIRVEEYKRPTFQVEFPEVKEHYEAGDTVVVRATARSYAGVPVQGASVKYKVVRRMAFWWWSYWRYWNSGAIGTGHDDEEVFSGEATTDDDGNFAVEIPMTLPESDHPLFYNFIATADVTDSAGETHSGQLSLPLGNRKTALSIDLADKVLAETNPALTLHLRNAAGNDIDATARYRIDNGKWQEAKTNTSCPLPSLKSGRHTVEATCDGDTLKREFIVFSLDDKRPATEADDWFYLSATQFPNDGKPVTLQVGSSAKDVHIVYGIFAGNELIETGSTDKSNELINRKLTYKEAYGNGLVLTYAWVKQGKCYTHTAQIRRPLPDKKLKLQWTTFRDRLTPGQDEEWTLTVSLPDGKPANAQLMATLYDKSLDQLKPMNWNFSPYTWLPMPNVAWQHLTGHHAAATAYHSWTHLTERTLQLSHFDRDIFPEWWRRDHFRVLGYGTTRMMKSRATAAAPMAAAAQNVAYAEVEEAADELMSAKQSVELSVLSDTRDEADSADEGQQQVQLRENLNETAFFYPQLQTDADGTVALKFTLPESLTTWHFMGLAHTKDLCYGLIEGEAVAKKEVMIQPNVPRFVREDDQAVLTARIFNTGEKMAEGTATLRLIDPETDKTVYENSQRFSVGVNATTTASFSLPKLDGSTSLLVCQVTATGKTFSDGEQHYLPVLPSKERVTLTRPFTQNQPGTLDIDLTQLMPADGKNGKLTVEYTNNPAWLMIQALPVVGKPTDNNAISQAASYYANSIGRHIIKHNPKAQTAFRLWQQETGNETSLTSALEKNQELKDLMLNETPWVMDADRETEQKQRLADFFDDNTMENRLRSALDKMSSLQREDGSWSWWPGMPGSFYMTVAVSEMLVRLNDLTGQQAETKAMLDQAFRYMGNEVVEMVQEMKREEKKGHRQAFPSFKALQWLYLSTLDGRTLPAKVQEANAYLLPLLKKDIKGQTLYEKAMTAVILAKTDGKRAKEYVRSLKEYTVYREEMGRYYDSPRAGYSWFDYKIPTQTLAIEALQRITPEDRQTIEEMQRWLLQSKRTQAWDTPINSVNAVYAFLRGKSLALDNENATILVDSKPLDLPKATAAIGYVKTVLPSPKARSLSVRKTSEGTSWGAVYAQFMLPAKRIADSGAGITVKREVLTPSPLTIGSRIKVRITIEADRDYDFIQVVDKRAACMEPVKQLSGYHQGAYCTPRDNSTNYYFDQLSKGKHVIETEYYIDRPGTYETGTCTVECAYAPEFRATTHSQTLIVK